MAVSCQYFAADLKASRRRGIIIIIIIFYAFAFSSTCHIESPPVVYVERIRISGACVALVYVAMRWTVMVKAHQRNVCINCGRVLILSIDADCMFILFVEIPTHTHTPSHIGRKYFLYK